MAQLDVQVEGAGTPVVLLHGFPDSKRLWAKQVPALVDAGFQVIVPECDYGAATAREVDAYAICSQIDVTTILDALDRACTIGHDGAQPSHGRPPFARSASTALVAPGRAPHLIRQRRHLQREVLVHAAVPVPGCR